MKKNAMRHLAKSWTEVAQKNRACKQCSGVLAEAKSCKWSKQLLKKTHMHNVDGSGGATRPLSRDGSVEFFGPPIVGLRPKVWTRGQKWK